MDKMQKMDFMQSIETYLNEHQVYELFEDLIRQVVVARPQDPHQFILQKIKARRSQRIFLLGAPGTKKQSVVEPLSEQFEWKKISAGQLIMEHVQARGPHAERIQNCLKNNCMGKLQILFRNGMRCAFQKLKRL